VLNTADLERSVKGMLPWQQLSGVEKATAMLYDAFREGTRIVVVGDFDADGATSTALSVLSLRAGAITSPIWCLTALKMATA
jgi:single-stranded-DNA-specific exonuclease